MHKVKTVKLNSHWKSQEVRGARNVEQPAQESGHVGRKQQGPRVGPPKPFEAHIMTSRAPDPRHAAVGFNVCCWVFGFTLVCFLIIVFLVLSFVKNVCPVLVTYCWLEVCHLCFFYF